MKKTRPFILIVVCLFSLILVFSTLVVVKAAHHSRSNNDKLHVQNGNIQYYEKTDEVNPTAFKFPDKPLAELVLYDHGDAPDSTNHLPAVPMTAYTPGGGPPNTQANFPSVFDIATGFPQGPRHGNIGEYGVHLGPGISYEKDADLTPDPDGITNLDPKADIPDLDAFDDGVQLPVALPHCAPTTFTYTVNIHPMAKGPFYVNVWFDWNRDGDWADALECPTGSAVSEHAVQNQSLSLPPLSPGLQQVSTPFFVPHNPSGGPVWMRITISDQPVQGGSDGQGPDSGYGTGETEDYYLPGDQQQDDYDIYIKDNPTDDGSVPSSTPWWVSPDIWTRNDGDCTNNTHQNPEAGEPTTICVRVRNRLLTPVTNIQVDLYFASAGLGLSWPASWAGIGSSNIPVLAPMSSVVKAIPWNTPNILGHFCLLARADSFEDPISSGPDTVLPVDVVPNNNNIAQRNLNTVDFPEFTFCDEITDKQSTDTFSFDVVNTKSSTETVDIHFDSADFPLDEGQVVLKPGALWGRWDSLINFNQIGMSLEVNGFPAEMNGVDLGPHETISMIMEITAPGDTEFEISVSELKGDKMLGGISYARILPACVYLPICPTE